ncbi:MAG: trimethylamine methyltransferase family protein [Pseudomonadota bacterium]
MTEADTATLVKGRRSGGSRGRKKQASQPSAPPRREKSLSLTVVKERQAEAIHRAVLRILWDVGLVVDDEQTRKLLLANGCNESDQGRICYPAELVERALETVPQKITLYDRNGALTVDTSDRVPHFCPGHNCVQVLDFETGEHRPCTLADVENVAKVSERLPNIDALASLGYPGDVPVEEEAVITVKALAENSRKPIVFTGHDEHEAEAIWTYLAEVAGGWDDLAAKPYGLDLIGPTSPLKLGTETCRRLQFAAERSLPVVCYPAIFPGMACPITLAGAVAQSSAESLAGVVISQLTAPGAPVMAGSSILPMDMRRADLAYGSPEYALGGLGCTDYLNHIGLPSWTGAGCSDSHDLNLQAAAEAGSNMTVAAMAGTAFVHNLGFLSGGRTGSIEMLVLCDELAGMASKFAAGIPVDEDTIALEVIKRAAAENAFISDPHTYARYETEMWIPGLFERSDLSIWLESGSTPIRQRIKEKVHELLA